MDNSNRFGFLPTANPHDPKPAIREARREVFERAVKGVVLATLIGGLSTAAMSDEFVNSAARHVMNAADSVAKRFDTFIHGPSPSARPPSPDFG